MKPLLMLIRDMLNSDVISNRWPECVADGHDDCRCSTCSTWTEYQEIQAKLDSLIERME